MMELILVAVLILLFLVMEAFFSGSEIAFISANRPRLLRMAKENNPRAWLAKSLVSRPELLFSTTVVGTTIAMNFATTIATLYLIGNFGQRAEWLNLFMLTPAILIFVEFIPKSFCRAHADALILKLSGPLNAASVILYPFTKALTLYAQVLGRLFGTDTPGKGFFLSREELKAALPASRGTDVTPSERMLIGRILEFGKITAKEMLRPLIDVVGIEQDKTIGEAIALFSESEHSRIPVYEERVDRIVGILQGFDCLRATDLTQSVKTLMQPPLFVPESKPLDELLLELRARPMAIAVNEFGGAEGIITMEDVIEEIVGEIEDEYDEPPRLYHQLSENSFIVNARMEIDDIREHLKISIPQDDDYQTLAGFLLKRMQKIPRKWDSAVIDGVEYIVQAATDRAVEEVYIIVHDRQG